MHYHQTCLPNCISPLTLNCETTYHCSLNATPLAERLNPVWKPSRPELRKALPQLQDSFDCTAWEQRGIKEFHCRRARPAAVTRCIFSRVEQHICSHDTHRWNVQCLGKKRIKTSSRQRLTDSACFIFQHPVKCASLPHRFIPSPRHSGRKHR